MQRANDAFENDAPGLRRCRRGSVALEFAVVAIPFFLLLCATIELAIVALAGAALDGAAREAARPIRTGETQQSPDPLAAFRGRLCDRLLGFVGCDEIVYDVRHFDDFASVAMPPLYEEDGTAAPTGFEPGDAGDIVVVRASLRWAYRTPMLATAFGAADQEVTASTVFKNEPFRGPPK
jgi:TadE-like protein